MMQSHWLIRKDEKGYHLGVSVDDPRQIGGRCLNDYCGCFATLEEAVEGAYNDGWSIPDESLADCIASAKDEMSDSDKIELSFNMPTAEEDDDSFEDED